MLGSRTRGSSIGTLDLHFVFAVAHIAEYTMQAARYGQGKDANGDLSSAPAA